MAFLVIALIGHTEVLLCPHLKTLLPNASDLSLCLSVTLIFAFFCQLMYQTCFLNSFQYLYMEFCLFFLQLFIVRPGWLQLFVNKVYILYILLRLDLVHWDTLGGSLGTQEAVQHEIVSITFNKKTNVKNRDIILGNQTSSSGTPTTSQMTPFIIPAACAPSGRLQ